MKKIMLLVMLIACELFVSNISAQTTENKESISKTDSVRSALSLYQELLELEKQMGNRNETIEPSVIELDLPCQEEAKSTEEYYGAWAVSDGKPNQSIAVQEAMRRAQLELAIQIGEKEVVLDDVEIVCRTISRDTRGNFIAYVAIRKPKNK